MRKIIIVIMVLCGCPAKSLHSPGKPTLIVADGAYIHTGTQLKFPVIIDNFYRVIITKFDPEAKDVSVGYDLTDARFPTSITVFTVGNRLPTPLA